MYSDFRDILRAGLLLGLGWAAALGAPPARVLRVAADPNNLPFSNERGEGFENRLAELVARELGARLEYTWWAQRRGFFRETIEAGRADLVVGVPAGFERVLTTRPYYRSTYVFVTRAGTPAVHSFDDATLRRRTIGVQMIGDDFYNSPPAHALAARGLTDNVRGYSVYGDYAQDSPPADIVRAVAAGDIEVAVAWGPMAGYFARRQPVPLELSPVSPVRDGVLPFTFAIAMGVRRGDVALQQEVDAILARCAAEIEQVLSAYGVPQLPLAADGKEVAHARGG